MHTRNTLCQQLQAFFWKIKLYRGGFQRALDQGTELVQICQVLENERKANGRQILQSIDSETSMLWKLYLTAKMK